MRDLVMYSRSMPCPFVSLAKRVLEGRGISYREIHIDKDYQSERRVVTWTGFQSVPTIIAANAGEDVPYEEPGFLAKGASPRGINRGSMITEPNEEQLVEWLTQHGFLQPARAE
jgi:glutaredoxin